MNSVERKWLEFLHPDAPRPRSRDVPNEKTLKAMTEKGWIKLIRDKGYPLSRDYEITNAGLYELTRKRAEAAAELVREFNSWTPPRNKK